MTPGLKMLIDLLGAGETSPMAPYPMSPPLNSSTASFPNDPFAHTVQTHFAAQKNLSNSDASSNQKVLLLSSVSCLLFASMLYGGCQIMVEFSGFAVTDHGSRFSQPDFAAACPSPQPRFLFFLFADIF